MATTPFIWGPGGQALSATDVARNRKVADALMSRVQNPQTMWEGLQSATGDIGGALLNWQADEAEEKGRSAVADALLQAQGGSDPNAFISVLGNEFASPAQSAVAQALLQRGWSKEDRDWEAAQPAWQFFEQDGDQYRFNSKDPNSRPEMFFDGADAPLEAPKIEEDFDPVTGRPRKRQWNAATGQWEDFGGVSAPKDPLVTVNTGEGADGEFYKAGSKARGEEFAAIETTGYQAQGKMGQINRLDGLLASSPQGLEGGWKQFVGEFGINSEGLDDIQAAQALINKLVPEQRMPGTGPMSDADLALFKQSMPRIINQPGGNKLIIETLRGIAVYEQKMGEIATRALNGEITPKEARQEMAAVQNPLEIFRKQGGSASDASTAPEGVDPAVWAAMTPEERKLWD